MAYTNGYILAKRVAERNYLKKIKPGEVILKKKLLDDLSELDTISSIAAVTKFLKKKGIIVVDTDKKVLN